MLLNIQTIFQLLNIDPSLSMYHKLYIVDYYTDKKVANMDPELPYNGDIMEAMKNRDIKAIRTIQSFIDKQNRSKESSPPSILPKNAASCTNNENIQGETWNNDDNPVDLRIFVYRTPNHKISELCYNRTLLYQWMSDPEHYFANWVLKEDNTSIDEQGYGGHPGELLFLRLPPYNQYFFSYTKLYNEDSNQFIAIPIEQYRVGNRYGTFGISQIHGQSPGELIYYIFNKEPNYSIKDYFNKLEQLRNDNALMDMSNEIVHPLPISSFHFNESPSPERFTQQFYENIDLNRAEERPHIYYIKMEGLPFVNYLFDYSKNQQENLRTLISSNSEIRRQVYLLFTEVYKQCEDYDNLDDYVDVLNDILKEEYDIDYPIDIIQHQVEPSEYSSFDPRVLLGIYYELNDYTITYLSNIDPDYFKYFASIGTYNLLLETVMNNYKINEYSTTINYEDWLYDVVQDQWEVWIQKQLSQVSEQFQLDFPISFYEYLKTDISNFIIDFEITDDNKTRITSLIWYIFEESYDNSELFNPIDYMDKLFITNHLNDDLLNLTYDDFEDVQNDRDNEFRWNEILFIQSILNPHIYLTIQNVSQTPILFYQSGLVENPFISRVLSDNDLIIIDNSEQYTYTDSRIQYIQYIYLHFQVDEFD